MIILNFFVDAMKKIYYHLKVLEHVQETGGIMKNVRETILTSAKKLILKNGYSKTTIRGIVKESGVLSGSIYHFFDSKEDIFNSLILELFDDCERKVIEKFGGIKSEEFLYALMTKIQLRAVEKNERIRELYYEAYTSNIIFEKIVNQGAKKTRQIFEKYSPSYTLNDYYNVNLMIKGAMRSCIVDCGFDNKNSSEKRNNIFLNMMLTLMNMPANEIDSIIKDINMMDIEIEYIIDELIKEKFE